MSRHGSLQARGAPAVRRQPFQLQHASIVPPSDIEDNSPGCPHHRQTPPTFDSDDPAPARSQEALVSQVLPAVKRQLLQHEKISQTLTPRGLAHPPSPQADATTRRLHQPIEMCVLSAWVSQQHGGQSTHREFPDAATHPVGGTSLVQRPRALYPQYVRHRYPAVTLVYNATPWPFATLGCTQPDRLQGITSCPHFHP